MSTDVQDPKTPASEDSIPQAASTAAVPVTPALPAIARPRLWQQRRNVIAAAIVVAAVVGAALGNNVLAHQYTPDGAVRQYLNALQSGNASEAWSVIQVSAPTQPVAATLTDQSAMQAALSVGRSDMKSFAVTGTSSSGSVTIVSVSYDTATGTKQAKFTLERSGETHFGFYPVWHLVLAPTLLSITLPAGGNGVTIDGKTVALPSGKSTVAVLPVQHKVQVSGTQMLAVETLTVDAFLSLGESVSYQPTLTPAGMDKAKSAIKTWLTEICGRRTQANIDDGSCPQGLSFQLEWPGQWQVVGDPTQDLAISFDRDLNIAAVGHFEMVFAYQEHGYQGTQHVASGGGYSAALQLGPTDLQVKSIQAAKGLPALARPAAATDQAAKDQVAQAFTKCAAVQAENVADCPQQAPDIAITNVHWTLTGDVLSGATVSFDPTTGLYTVHGNFSMSVSYLWLDQFSRSGNSYVKAYNARLFWDGQSFQLVTIEGATS
jgi:hypothetical protein